MARGSSRVKLHRSRLDDVTLAVGDGLMAVLQEVLDVAVVPDAPPLSEGLVEKGALGVWVQGKKIGGTADKPKAVKVRQTAIVGVVGYPRPAGFLEKGTIKMAARPFLGPAWDKVSPQVDSIMGSVVRPILNRKP